jgi:hypothetical protein
MTDSEVGAGAFFKKERESAKKKSAKKALFPPSHNESPKPLCRGESKGLE